MLKIAGILRFSPYFGSAIALYFRANARIMKACDWFRLRPVAGLSGFVSSKSVADVPVGERPTLFLGAARFAGLPLASCGNRTLAGQIGNLLGGSRWMVAELNKIRDIAGRVAATHGVEVVDVEMRGGGKARTLKITIDKPEGVTHEDCANVSREVSTILDVEDAVPGSSYMLEVSSPGLDRKLLRSQDYLRFVGSRIKIMTRQAVDGNRHFEGRLQSFQDDKLALELTGKKPKPGRSQPPKIVEIDLANVEKANVVPEI
jgi:ribosome maturation factor RimP